MPIVYSRKYLPMKDGFYCVTSKEQADLAKKFPGKDVELSFKEMANFLSTRQDLRPTSANKVKTFIAGWFSGASVTR